MIAAPDAAARAATCSYAPPAPSTRQRCERLRDLDHDHDRARDVSLSRAQSRGESRNHARARSLSAPRVSMCSTSRSDRRVSIAIDAASVAALDDARIGGEGETGAGRRLPVVRIGNTAALAKLRSW